MESPQSQSPRVDVLGTAPVRKLYLRMSLPIVISMVVNGSYNLVDAAFVTRGVGPLAMGGVAMAFPLHMLMYSTGAMIGNGAASILARMLGAKKLGTANAAALTAILMAVLLGILIGAVGLGFLDPILRAFGASAELLPYGRDFLTPLLWGAPVVLLATVFAELLRAEGKAGAMSSILMLSTVSNMVLAALFVFVLKSGVKGVACATLIAQSLGLVVAASLYLRGRTVVKPTQPAGSINPGLASSLLALGFPAFIGNGGIALMIALANKALANYGGPGADLLISSYGVVSRVSAFIQLPLIGMMIGYQTIAGYNYGAQRPERVLQMVRIGLATATLYTVVCSLLMVLIPATLLRVFTADPRLVEQGAAISRILFLGLGLSGVSIMGGALFQALGKAKTAMFLSLVKVFLVLAPLLLVLPARVGVTGVWYAFPIADVTVFLVVSFFLSRQYLAIRKVSGDIGLTAQAGTATR